MMTMYPTVNYVALDKEYGHPSYAHDGDAGMDLCITENVTIEPFRTVLVGTGVAMAIPDGFYGDLRPRSGMATKRGVTLANTPGTLDSTYRGEIKVALHNMTPETVTVRRGERVAQLLIKTVAKATMVEVSDLDKTERGDGGFGSTGYGRL